MDTDNTVRRINRGRDATVAGDGQAHELALEILARMPRSLALASGFMWFDCEDCAGEGIDPHDPEWECETCDGDRGFEDEDPFYDLDDIIDAVTRRRGPRGTERVVTALAEIIRSNRLALTEYEEDIIRWRQLRLPRLPPSPAPKRPAGRLATR